MPRFPSEVVANVRKAREPSLLAVETYNRPGTAFRSAGYVVLMVIAWTAVFHAIFFKRKMKPYYRKRGTRRFALVSGEPKTWELDECLKQFYQDQNPAIRKNLEFFIELRNKIEHRFLPDLDTEIFGECQAMLMNFEAMLTAEFGDKQGVGRGLPYALQFSKSIVPTQQKAMRGAAGHHMQSIRRFVTEFRSALSDNILSDESYSFKVFLIPKVGSHAKSSDVAVEFVRYDASKPEQMKQYERLVALIKPKQISVANVNGLKAGQVVEQVAARLGKKFTQHSHCKCWRHYNTRPPGHSETPEVCDNRHCYYDAVHQDYIYTPAWVEFLVQTLGDEATYELVLHGAALIPGQQ
jgi:hypothetical protein